MNPLKFSLEATDGEARSGQLTIGTVSVPTPVFMPVGTRGTVKALTNEHLSELGFRLILGNTYHLAVRPGDALIAKLGGLKRFMNWPGLILTDSGGFQAFSLQRSSANLVKRQKSDGFIFRNHIDGGLIHLTPEKAIDIQLNLQSDIAMCLDVCLESSHDQKEAAYAVQLTSLWAKRCWERNQKQLNLFGIVQGSTFENLRLQSLEELKAIDFPGMAIGGVSVGESKEANRKVVAFITPKLPGQKPRYLMGVGDPEDMIFAIGQGVDMFDCVMPTRNARNGELFTWRGKISIKRKEFALDERPIEESCSCYTCRNFSRAYLRHLFLSKEILASTLNSCHNLAFLQDLTRQARTHIKNKTYTIFQQDFAQHYRSKSLQILA